ncbi:hypothetical protein Taro_040515 [Colocasia esculenta]|uniref:Uncharacterized protein n=1 Tax=Colocasia esculenta TaxID=4460 RepID=A0A843WJ98_COLES|nr:hypothetical protein [Colocasia esculenta]
MRPVSPGTAAAAPASLAAAAARTHQPAMPQQHSAWRSPVPYLFGGLAALLGLTFLALLLLACTRRKLSSYMHRPSRGGDGSGGLELVDAGAPMVDPCRDPLGQSVLVIMAGDEKPTFLATPASSPCSSDDQTTMVKGSEENGTEVERTPGREESALEARRSQQQEGLHGNEDENHFQNRERNQRRV